MLPIHIGVVSESGSIQASELTSVAAALAKQVTRDFGPIWGVQATVAAFGTLDDLPVAYWPVIVMDNINVGGAAGVHEDKNGQPFALVQYSPSWSLTASHETLEMLGDPTGNRLVSGKSPMPKQGQVAFLVEVCDPCEDAKFAYSVNGVTVSDFITPQYEDPLTNPSVRYSFTGAVTKPHQVLPGGYLSWHDPVSNHWWQEVWLGTAKPKFRDLGAMTQRSGSVRAWIDRRTLVPQIAAGLKETDASVKSARAYRTTIGKSTHSRAQMLRNEIKRLVRKR